MSEEGPAGTPATANGGTVLPAGEAAPGHARVPGDHPPRRLLERPPSERFAPQVADTRRATTGAGASARGRARQAIAIGSLVAALGATVHVATAVALDWTGGLLLVAASVGVAVGLAVRFGGGVSVTAGRRRLASLLLGPGSIAGALAVNWALSPRYLDPGAYLDQVYGPLVPLQLILVALAALAASR